MAEKLGVGLLLGALVQGVFAKEPSAGTYVVSAAVIAIAIFFITLAIYLSRED